MTRPPFLTSPGLAARHGFFTRAGGVSAGPYASLNGSVASGDAAANVAHNRARIAACFAVPADRLLGLSQVHGANVVTVTEPWPVGAGPRADAMVCAVPGLALGIVTADCVPVLFADRHAGIVGAAHAGWRGALAGVLEATAAAMRALGASAIEAAIGPCIAQHSYEVGADLHDAVTGHDPAAACHFQSARPGHWQFDLPGYCAARLTAVHVTVAMLGIDTYADAARFWSHRRRTHQGGGPIGHQLSVIAL